MIKIKLQAIIEGYSKGGRLVISFRDISSIVPQEIYWTLSLDKSDEPYNSVVLNEEEVKNLIKFLTSSLSVENKDIQNKNNDDFPNEYEKQIGSKNEEIKKLNQDMNFLRESLVFSTKQTEALEKKIRDTREKIWDTFKELHE